MESRQTTERLATLSLLENTLDQQLEALERDLTLNERKYVILQALGGSSAGLDELGTRIRRGRGLITSLQPLLQQLFDERQMYLSRARLKMRTQTSQDEGPAFTQFSCPHTSPSHCISTGYSDDRSGSFFNKPKVKTRKSGMKRLGKAPTNWLRPRRSRDLSSHGNNRSGWRQRKESEDSASSASDFFTSTCTGEDICTDNVCAVSLSPDLTMTPQAGPDRCCDTDTRHSPSPLSTGSSRLQTSQACERAGYQVKTDCDEAETQIEQHFNFPSAEAELTPDLGVSIATETSITSGLPAPADSSEKQLRLPQWPVLKREGQRSVPSCDPSGVWPARGHRRSHGAWSERSRSQHLEDLVEMEEEEVLQRSAYHCRAIRVSSLLEEELRVRLD